MKVFSSISICCNTVSWLSTALEAVFGALFCYFWLLGSELRAIKQKAKFLPIAVQEVGVSTVPYALGLTLGVLRGNSRVFVVHLFSSFSI